MASRRHPWAWAVGLVALSLVGPPLAAAATLKPITGRIDKPGYTVIALAATGQAGSVIAPSGSFRVVPPAATVTLQLRAPDGVYAGPVVLQEQGDIVKEARTAVTRAENKVMLAKKTVANAQRALRRARGAQAKRRAAKRLKQAKSQLKTAGAQLTKARKLLSEAKKQVAERPNLAIVGVKAGTPLGAVMVNTAGGYAVARLSERLWKTWVDTTRWARATKGVPIGAGNLGRVLSRPPRVSSPGDLDADGIPDALDVDVNGNLILNDADTTRNLTLDDVAPTAATRARTAQAQPGGLSAATFLWTLQGNAAKPPATQPLNANAAGITDADINAAVASDLQLGLAADTPLHPYASGELDCGGLTWCSAGGTGMRAAGLPNFMNVGPYAQPFPACCDPDGNGLGSLDVNSAGQHGLSLNLEPHATTDQIRPGDLLLVHATCNAGLPCGPAIGSSQVELTSTLASVWATVPALVSYTDATGPHTVTYPIVPGTSLPVYAGPDPSADVVVTLTFWRPQRLAIPDEAPAGAGKWIDMGGLTYFALGCPEGAYSNVDPSLTPSGNISTGAGPTFSFLDTARDQPADPHNTFSYTLDLSECNLTGQTFRPGDTKDLVFDARLPQIPGLAGGQARSGYAFYRQP